MSWPAGLVLPHHRAREGDRRPKGTRGPVGTNQGQGREMPTRAHPLGFGADRALGRGWGLRAFSLPTAGRVWDCDRRVTVLMLPQLFFAVSRALGQWRRELPLPCTHAHRQPSSQHHHGRFQAPSLVPVLVTMVTGNMPTSTILCSCVPGLPSRQGNQVLSLLAPGRLAEPGGLGVTGTYILQGSYCPSIWGKEVSRDFQTRERL